MILHLFFCVVNAISTIFKFLFVLLQAFKREVVFVVDISKSMTGKPLENVNNAILAALSKLNLGDSFNIMTFSNDTSLFSTSMEPATPDTVERGIEWMNKNFVVADGTNVLPPLEKVLTLLTCSLKSLTDW